MWTQRFAVVLAAVAVLAAVVLAALLAQTRQDLATVEEDAAKLRPLIRDMEADIPDLSDLEDGLVTVAEEVGQLRRQVRSASDDATTAVGLLEIAADERETTQAEVEQVSVSVANLTGTVRQLADGLEKTSSCINEIYGWVVINCSADVIALSTFYYVP